jgi:hypothetical protein
MESSKFTRNYVSSIFLLVSLLQTIFASASSNTELITNGSFENQFDRWKTYVVNDMYGRVNLTSGNIHSGESSLRTYAIPLRKSPYTLKRGGGAIQTISTDVNELDMKFSFWVMSSIVGENDYTNTRSIINIKLTNGQQFNLSYYVAWAPRIVNESTSNSTENIVYIIPTKLNQWSHIQRSIINDLEPLYNHSSNSKISKLSVILEMITISNMLSHDAFWDDISITYQIARETETLTSETLSQETPSPQMLQSTVTQTSTLTKNSTQQVTQSAHLENHTLYTIGLITIIVIGTIFLITKRKKQ